MKAQHFPFVRSGRILPFAMLTIAVFSIAIFCQTVAAQQAELSLADFLIGLRSKKVTLQERNKILAEAAKTRGVTFALTPEIEKELENTGADKELIDAIRAKSPVVKVSATIAAKPDPVPVSTPPPDHGFYVRRANSFIAKGDFDGAIADLSKAIELNSTDAADFVSRGMAYYNKKSYDLAIADYDKALGLKPNESMTFVDRAFANEKLGNSEKALADFKKALELDATNETASLNVKRLEDEKAKLAAKDQEKTAADKPVETSSQKAPDSISMGQLTAAQATKMVMPVYSDVARKANIEGKVTVYVTLDEAGNVATAKAESGHPFLRQAAEDAARKSKFKPAMFGTTPVKGSGFIVYNFTRNN